MFDIVKAVKEKKRKEENITGCKIPPPPTPTVIHGGYRGDFISPKEEIKRVGNPHWGGSSAMASKKTSRFRATEMGERSAEEALSL
jgi:hypothetical protein